MIGKKLLFLFCFSTACFQSMAQIQSLEDFKTSIESLSEDETFKKIDARILELTKLDAHDSLFYHTFEVQCDYAIKVNKREAIEYSATKLIEYPQYFEKKKLYSYLKWVADLEYRKGAQDRCVELYLQAIDVAEEIGNDTILAEVNKKLGIHFSVMKNFELAKKYLFKSLKIAENITYDKGIGSVCMTIGNVYKNTAVYDTALHYYNKSIDHSKLAGYQRGVAGNYNNLGSLYRLQKQYDKSIDHFLDAIPLNIEMNNLPWLAINYSSLGEVYFDIEQYDQAQYYMDKSFDIYKELKDSSKLGNVLIKRSEVYAKKKRYKQAYNDLVAGKKLRSKFANREKLALAAQVEANFNSEKKEAEIKQLEAERNAQAIKIEARNDALVLEAQLQKENEYILYGFGAVLLGLLGVVFAFWRSGKQRKEYTQELYSKNSEIESVNSSLNTAKEVLTVKNEEILDSITYAKRIQAAILPSEKHLHQSLKEAFVLYLPKDIVAGDFYWTEEVGDTILFAVADCTGHGVPGAMVSVICNNALNDTIKLQSITDPGKILDHTTDLILHQFEKAEEDVKDGMDIGLCAFNRKTRQLKYAGANIPLWIVRDGQVIEIKATRQPVGKYVLRQKFQTNKIDLVDGDMIYMSSDGFADQFGGNRNKKFMKKNFKNLLIGISNKPIHEQNKVIKNAFSEWKSDNEQVDDICVMGVKFKAS